MTQALYTRRALALMLPAFVFGIQFGLIRDAWWVGTLLQGLMWAAPFLGIYFWDRERFERLLYIAPWVMLFAGAIDIVREALSGG